MAFDAGAIEATLTLNRNPFTAGLAAAKAQARKFAADKIEVDVKVNVDQRSLVQAEALLKKFNGRVARATARVLVDRLQFNALLTDLRRFAGTTYSARVDVDTTRATANVIAFRTLLGTLNDQTVNLNANTRAFGGAAGNGFGQGSSHFARMASLIIGTLPVIASGFTATVGLVGALASAFIIAGLGAGALALVVVPAFKQIKAAVAGGQAEIDKLPPGLREAGNAMKEMNTAYDQLIKNNQRIVGIGLAAWFNAGTAALKTLNPLVDAAGKAFSTSGAMMEAFFKSTWWEQFVGWLADRMLPAVTSLTRGIMAMIQIIGNLTRAFWDLGGSDIFEMVVSGLEDFAAYTERIGQNTTFIAFMEAAKRSLPVVAKFIGELVEFIFKLAIGLEPLGTIILRVFNGILDVLNEMPIPILQALALGVAALMVALALGAGGPVALGIAAIASLATIFADVYTKNEELRTGLNKFADDLRVRFLPIWDTIVRNFNDHIKPAWEDLVRLVNERLIPSLQRFGDIFLQEVWPKIQPFVNNITEIVIPAVLRFLGALTNIISFLVDIFGPTVARELGAAVTVFDGSFQMIAGLLDIFTGVFTGNWTTFTQGITTLTRGFWTVIAGMFGTSFDELKRMVQEWDAWIDNTWRTFWDSITGFFRGVWNTLRDIWSAALALMRGDIDSAVRLIGQAWSRVANFFREPINWVIRTVIGPPGGLAGAWNTVMGWIGQPQLSVSAPPQIPVFGGTFSTGGVLPGYAPRKDSLLAAVSPGEAIMVPEWTRAVGGPDAVAKMNQDAMRGALYYEGNPRGYSIGGMIPHFAYGGVAPHVAAAGDEVTRVFGRMPGGIGGVGARANASDHPSGFALDFMTLGNRGLGNRVAGFLTANWQRLAIKYLIWLQRIASSPGAWRGMADRGSPTANHMDHVHASFLGGPGGGGGAAPVPMVSWWSILAGKVTGLIKGLFSGTIPGLGGPMGQAISRVPVALIDKTIAALQSKLEGLMTVLGSTPALDAAGGSNTSLGFGTADLGATIPPGRSSLFNATGRPETLTNLDVYERMVDRKGGLSVEDVLRIIESRGGGGGDTYNVMLPEKASVRELADSLDFKRKVVQKGRYSR